MTSSAMRAARRWPGDCGMSAWDRGAGVRVSRTHIDVAAAPEERVGNTTGWE